MRFRGSGAGPHALMCRVTTTTPARATSRVRCRGRVAANSDPSRVGAIVDHDLSWRRCPVTDACRFT